MKRFSRIFFLTLLLILLNTTDVFALRGYVNPIIIDGNYWQPVAGKEGDVTYNSTSVTLMWDGLDGSGGIETTVVPGACYVLGKAYSRDFTENIKVDEDNNEEIKSSDPWLDPITNKPYLKNDSDHTDEEQATARARFFRKGYEAGGDWYEPFWIQDPENVNRYGWTTNDFARQAGGSLCGFLDNPIQGGASDNPSDYVRADSEGKLWYRNLCENFEGVRTDCNEEFALGKRYKHALFRVTCGYFSTDDPQYAEDVARGAIDNGRMPPPSKHRSYQMQPDELCDISKANYNADGKKELQVFENGLYIKTMGRDISEKKLWKGAFRLVVDSKTGSYDPDASFVVNPVFSLVDYNPQSKEVKTEFGNIPRNPTELATAVLRIAIGVAGGVAFLLMIFGAFRLIFARGDPDQVQQGREILTAAIIGLLVIIFATFLLQLIGISALGLDI